MTDRYNALTVVLERDIRDDDAEKLIDAIKHLRGVLDVTANVADLHSHVAERRARLAIERKLYEALRSGE